MLSSPTECLEALRGRRGCCRRPIALRSAGWLSSPLKRGCSRAFRAFPFRDSRKCACVDCVAQARTCLSFYTEILLSYLLRKHLRAREATFVLLHSYQPSASSPPPLLLTLACVFISKSIISIARSPNATSSYPHQPTHNPCKSSVNTTRCVRAPPSPNSSTYHLLRATAVASCFGQPKQLERVEQPSRKHIGRTRR